MSEVLERLALLSGERRALFRKLLAVSNTAQPAIPRLPRRRSVPMSYAQQRLWMIDQLEPGNAAYTCPVPVRLRGALDTTALRAAIEDVVARHDVLRTTYGIDGGVASQFVHDNVDVPFVVHDFRALSRDAAEAAVDRVLLDDANRPFDLARGPIVRAELIRLAADEHVLMIDVHHIANDHWSIRVLFQELSRRYNQLVGRTADDLPPLLIQYADYAAWQRQRIEGDFGARQLAYWREALTGMTPADLPADRARPPVLSPRGGTMALRLDAPLVERLRALARQESATLFMVLLAAFMTILARYTAQEDVAVGCSVTGRDRAEVEPLIGFFVNTIVLRASVEETMTFRELLRRVRGVALGAYAHADYPFDLVVKEINPIRSAGRIPLVPVMFTLDDTPAEIADLDGIEASWVEPSFTTTKFDLLVNARPSAGGGVYGHVQYSTDLFDAATIDGLVSHYETLLAGFAERPDAALCTTSMLTAAERETILISWNDTATPYPREARIHELFETHAEERSGEPAIITTRGTITYGQLDAAANRRAARLRRRGVGPGSLVAIHGHRSPELVATALAVLKCEAAYVPLDAGYYSDARVAELLAELEIEFVADLNDAADDESAEHVRTAGSSEDLAYVICTSGSTGRPKAIELRHRGVVNNLLDLHRRFGVGPGDRVAFLSSPSFDMSIYETLGMAVAGATIVIPDPDAWRDPAQWLALLQRERITIWNSAPPLLELLVAELERTSSEIPFLRLALLGGDWVPLSLPDRLRARAPHCRIVVLGGATEASIHSTIFEVERVERSWKSIPYGVPMANQRVYVLDRAMQPVPAGVPGELYLAGDGLARGYRGRPDLTSEKFVSWAIGERREQLFRTGDLARWRRDGVLELLGRIDFQVKVHGLRVDLIEIEAVLRRQPGVEECAVVMHDGALAAYYVPSRDITPAALRAAMARSLPSYMVPSRLMAMDRLPLNSSGKVDRRVLLRPAVEDAGQRIAVAADVIEQRVFDVWRELLGHADFSHDDDFFSAGGDSFLAIRAVQMLDAGIAVADLFGNPTVRSLAACIRETAREVRLLHLLTPRAASVRASLICVPYGGGNAGAYQPLAHAVPRDVALWSVALPGHDPTREGEPLVAFADLAERCRDEVLARVAGPLILYGQCAGAALAVSLARLLEDAGADVRAVYAGAALPDEDPEQSQAIESTVSDAELTGYLRSLGGFAGALDHTALATIIRAVRHDLRESSRWFARGRVEPAKLRAPLRCLIGGADAATPRYAARVAAWDAFAAAVELHVIDEGGHYFVQRQPTAVAALLALDLGAIA